MQQETPAGELYLKMLDHLDRGDGLSALSSMLLGVEALPSAHPHRPFLLQSAHRAIALCQRLEQYQQKERALRDVFEIAQGLTELKALDSVLFDIVERARKLLGSDLAWLAGEDAGSVQVLAIDGANTEAVKHMHGPATSGIAGYVAGTRSAFTTQDYLNDSHFRHEPGIDAAIREEGLQSVIAVPILSESAVIGVVIVGDRYRRSYQPWEVSILATFAAHASVAIRNARTFELKQQALRESEHANKQLEEKISELQLGAEAHDRLSRQLAQGGSLQDMLDVVSDILGEPTRFLDPAGVELCGATPPGRTGTGSRYGADDKSRAFRQVMGASERSRLIGRSVPVEEPATVGDRVMAVSSGDDHLGALLVEADQPLGENEILIFERCSTAMGVLTLLAERRSVSARQDADLTLRALLDESRNHRTDLDERARRHGLDTRRPMLLVVGELERAKLGYVVRRVGDRLRHAPHMVSELDGLIVALINRDEVHPLKEELETAIFRELKAEGVASISPPLENAASLPRAFESAKKVLSLTRKMGRRNCLVYEPELSMYAILFQEHSAEDLARLLDATIGPMLAYDKRRGARLTETLLTFLDHGQNARATARELGVHVNTIHSRLETIQQVMGEWDSSGRTADLHMALRLRSLLGY
ncbi:MAG: GAF domain-containing protein [Ectothiorhodospiraceae bacterium]|nr:GAF domain-containing protein [Ectothiorhodospiraceae bacterium]